jgi:hypothetical protein
LSTLSSTPLDINNVPFFLIQSPPKASTVFNAVFVTSFSTAVPSFAAVVKNVVHEANKTWHILPVNV